MSEFEDRNKLILKTFEYLRFPLMFLVVMNHAQKGNVFEGINILQENTFPLYTSINYLFSEALARATLPLFFIISGWLFFYNISDFSFSVYKQKLIRRVKGLLVPYIIWNILVILYISCKQLVSGNEETLIFDIPLTKFLWLFWDTSKSGIEGLEYFSFPICDPFWYIRDLMIVAVLSPLLYFLIKKVGFAFICVLLFLWMPGIWVKIPTLNSVLFFTIGAYFCINKTDIISMARSRMVRAMVLFAVLTISIMILKEGKVFYVLRNINFLVCIVWMLGLMSYLVSKRNFKVPKRYTKGVFFIFASHVILLNMLYNLFKVIDLPCNELVAITYLFFRPLAVVVLGIFINNMIYKVSPKVYNYLNGYR